MNSVAYGGTNKWTSIGPAGGQIISVAIDPEMPTTVYAATVSAGIFKSDDSGETWRASNTGFKGTPWGGITIDPADHQVLYANTIYSGTFKSTDSGNTWSLISTEAGPSAFDTISATMYGVNSTGVVKSSNGGSSWISIYSRSSSDETITALATSPIVPNVVFVVDKISPGGFMICSPSPCPPIPNPPGIWKSADGGATWALANTGMNADTVHSLVPHPTISTLWYANTSDGIYKSTDGGMHWQLSSSGIKNSYLLAISPSNPALMYAAADNGIFKSIDGGTSWSLTSNLGTNIQALVIWPEVSPVIYGQPSNTGLVKSLDEGVTWQKSSLVANSISALAVQLGTPGNLYAATLANFYTTADNGIHWSENHSLRVNVLAQDPTTPSLMYAGTSANGVIKSNDNGVTWIETGLTIDTVSSLIVHDTTILASANSFLYRSTDKGQTWVTYSNSNAISQLASSHSAPNVIYAGTANGVLKSVNDGVTWNKIGLSNMLVTALAVDPATPAIIYAAIYNKGLFKSVDGGVKWGSIGPSNTNIWQIRIDATKSSLLYLGTDTGIFTSTDAGATWDSMNAGLTNLNINALVIDPASSNHLYAGTGGGVFDITITSSTANTNASQDSEGSSSSSSGGGCTIGPNADADPTIALLFLSALALLFRRRSLPNSSR